MMGVVFADHHKPESRVKASRWQVLCLHMQPDARSSRGRGFPDNPFDQPMAMALASGFGHQADIDYQDTRRTPLQIKTADRSVRPLYDQEFGVRKHGGEMLMLEPELIVEKGRLRCCRPGDRGHLLGAKRTVELAQEVQIEIVRVTQL